MPSVQRRRKSDVSNVSHWSGDSTDSNTHQSILGNSSASKRLNIRFSKVLIVNNTATAYITKDDRIPGSTKDVVDRYFTE